MDQMLDYSIRSACEEDRDQIAVMWIDFLAEQALLDPRFVVADDAAARWRNDFAEWTASQVHGLYVAESGDRLIGFASVHLWYPAPIYEPKLEAYLNELYVRAEWRKRGAGTALLGKVREWARAKEASRIRLGVLSENESGRAFWVKSGGRPFVASLLIDI